MAFYQGFKVRKILQSKSLHRHLELFKETVRLEGPRTDLIQQKLTMLREQVLKQFWTVF